MKRPRADGGVRIHKEANPDVETLARVEVVEAELAAMKELGDWSEAEVLELLDETAEVLRLLLPGKVHGYHQGLKPAAPTKALPGSAEKIKIMRERVARGESCFHPGDAPPVPHSEVV